MIVKDEYERHFEHIWRTFGEIVAAFDADAWTRSGYGLTTPAQTAFYIIRSTQYYIGDESGFVLASGTTLNIDRDKINDSDLPSQEDILSSIPAIRDKVTAWIRQIRFDDSNRRYPWTGESMLSIVLFLTRHSQFHLGEMSALLNNEMKGKAEDHFAATLKGNG